MKPLANCVYVLFSHRDGKFYVGFSTDLDRRLKEHQDGKARSTKYRRPLSLVYCEYFLDQEDARRRELYFKTTMGKKMLHQALGSSIRKLKGEMSE